MHEDNHYYVTLLFVFVLDMVKPGAVVIDVGINKVDGALCGDVDFDKVKDVVYAISPVPGGVGPLTVMSLFQNLIDSQKK